MEQHNDKPQVPQVYEITDEDLCSLSIANLEPKYRRLINLYISGAYTISQIATTIGVAPNTVRAWLAKPEVKEAVNAYQLEETDLVTQGLKALRLKAMHKMSDLVDSNVDGIAWQAAKDILDRTGHKAVQKKEVDIEIKTFEQQLMEVMNDAVDAEFEEIADSEA